MSSEELFEAGFDMPTRPNSGGKSKGGKERILVSGLDAKDIADRVLERRKGKKKPKDESKEAPNEEPVENPFNASDFILSSPKAPHLKLNF
jgi:hypothetical protein